MPTRAIAGVPDLMHHKYVVRDGMDVWTGSTNWTDDSWRRQENVIVRVEGAPGLARAYTLNMDELWERVASSTRAGSKPRPTGDPGIEVRAWFTPGYGEALSHRVAKMWAAPGAHPHRLARADLGPYPRHAGRDRERAALRRRRGDRRDAGRRGVSPVGTNGVSAWKIPLLADGAHGGSFSGKPSTRWTPESYDFMHAKLVVADDIVFVGSFNFSRSGERNAENVLEIHDPTTADRLATFVDGVRGATHERRAPEQG